MLTFWAQFIVMFRSRFSDHFPPKLAHIGPQDLERGVQQDIPTKEVEGTLCALLGLVLNRKKPVEYVHPPEQQRDETMREQASHCGYSRINTNIIKAWPLRSRARGSSLKSQIAMALEVAGRQPAPWRPGLQQHVSREEGMRRSSFESTKAVLT
jgi:hypothetical protein